MESKSIEKLKAPPPFFKSERIKKGNHMQMRVRENGTMNTSSLTSRQVMFNFGLLSLRINILASIKSCA